MAQELYLKTRLLYEEFQKKELHYINLERKMQSNIMWKRDLNLPLQEYLQRINQREKETEETYKNILEQMNELDHHTDALSLKLEKLGILRASVATSVTPNWSQKLDFSIGSNYSTHNLSTKDIISLSAKSVSTQTENNASCKKCDPLTNNQPSYVFENLSSDPHLRINDKTETANLSNHQSYSNSLINKTHNISQDIESKSMGHISLLSTDNSPEDDLKMEHFLEKHSNQNSGCKDLFENKNTSFETRMHVDSEFIDDNTQYNVSKDIENPSVSQSIANEKNGQIKVPDGELYEKTYVSKSDADSINNEFDFLESNVTNMPMHTKMNPEEDVDNIKSSKIHKVANLESQQSRDSQLPSVKKVVVSNSKLNTADEESEVSGSVSGYNSPHMSVASDSDDVYEKGSSLTASAAYQALLGNTVHPTRTPQKESVSESEDEVENALASAVQRNHLKSKSSAKQIQDGAAQQPSSTKPLDKPTSSNKQSKLSKNTRKVLGLDSSSASEVEIAVNSPKGKATNDDDSDEFGFYD